MSATVRLFVRVIAWVYDFLLVGVPIVVSGITLFNFEMHALFFFIVIFTLYVTATPVLSSGYTLGKRIVGVRIISLGSELTLKTIIIRHIITGIIYIISCGIALIISIFMVKYGNDQKALHDFFAKTNVVIKSK